MRRITLLFAMLGISLTVSAQIFHGASLNPTAPSGNLNFGINQSDPLARLHISDDLEALNCIPAILIESNGSTTASDAPGGEQQGMESAACETPYIFRNNQITGTTTSTNFNIGADGRTQIGNIFGYNEATSTYLSVDRNIGAYKANDNFVKFGFSNIATASSPVIAWSNPTLEAFSIGYGADPGTSNRTLNVASNDRVGVNTVSPLAALHVKSDLSGANDGPTGQIQGILIENNGIRDHDFAFEIRTGQRPANATMTNGRVFTVSNGGTVHVGEGLNWQTTYDPDVRYRLYVQGGIRTEKVRVDIASENQWADYVFENEYKMLSTPELEAYIKEHKHLPGIPSAEEVVREGIDLAEMNKLLLEKVEELTLRVIELDKKLSE